MAVPESTVWDRDPHTEAKHLVLCGYFERLGHSSVAFTMQVYQHVVPGMQADATATLGEMVFGS